MHWMAKKIRKEAQRNNLDVDDLIEAVSAVQSQQRGMIFDAQLYRDRIKKESAELFEVAGDIAQYFEEQKSHP